MKKIKCFSYLFLFLMFTLSIYAKDNKEISEELDEIENSFQELRGNVKNVSSKSRKNVVLSGFSRYELRALIEDEGPEGKKVTTEAYVTCYDMQFLLNFKAQVARDFTFNAQFGVDSLMDGKSLADSKVGSDFIVKGVFKTEYGNYNLYGGGAFWIANTLLTFASPGGGTRKFIFNRNPWDKVVSSAGVYKGIVKWRGAYSDERSGCRGIKGLRLEGTELPLDMTVVFFYGKNDQMYENASDLSFGRIEYPLGKNIFSLNYSIHNINYNNKASPDTERKVFSIVSKARLTDFDYFFEGAYSYKKDRLTKSTNGFACALNVSVNREKVFFIKNPVVFLNFYNVEPDFKEENSGVVFVENSIMEEGYLYSNHRGLFLKLGSNLFQGNFLVGLGHSVTIKKTGAVLNFPHLLDERMWYQIYAGMEDKYNGNLMLPWNEAKENIQLNDTAEKIRHSGILTFNFNYDLGQSFEFLKRTYLITRTFFQNINNNFVLFPVKAEGDLLTGSYQEIFIAYGIMPDLFLINYIAQERWEAKKSTPVIDHKETSYGFGINYDLMAQTAIYLKFRIFKHKDFENNNNNFKGKWVSLEVKSYF